MVLIIVILSVLDSVKKRHRSSVKPRKCEAMRGIALDFNTLLSLLESYNGNLYVTM